MELTRLFQPSVSWPSVFLCLAVCIATGHTSHHATRRQASQHVTSQEIATETPWISQGSRSQYPRLPSCTKCSLGPFQRNISCTDMGLKHVPQNLYPGVEELDLSGNDIRHLFNSSFSKYQRLRSLSLDHNKIEKVDNETFYTMPVLEYLYLGFNRLHRFVASTVFKFSTQLTHLSFVSNKLKYFHNDAFKLLPKLQMLDLRLTYISHINLTSCSSQENNLTIDLRGSYIKSITPENFRIDCKLDCLILSENDISRIDPNTVASIRTRSLAFDEIVMAPRRWESFFTGIANSDIEELLLQKTYVGSIDPHYFAPLRNKHLRLLDLTNNKLKDLDNLGFLDLPLITTLILNNDSIYGMKIMDFARMTGLKVLYLNHNYINRVTGVSSNTSFDLAIEELYLAYNNLAVLNETSFKGLTNLKILVLRGNENLYYLEITAVSGLTNLQFLDFSGCVLARLWVHHAPNLEMFIYSDCKRSESLETFREFFSGTKSLKHVIFSNAQMSSLWTPNSGNNISLFQGMRNLISLDVKKNPIELLQSGLFLDLVCLEDLDLSECGLTKIEEKAFHGLQRLKILHLQDNLLHSLSRGTLENMGQLSKIHLDGNQLRYLENDLFVNSSKLQNLTLASNRFSGFNHSTFKPILNSLRSIDISDNELTCTCNLKWLPMWLAGPITIQNENDTRCSLASLETLQEKPLMTFNPTELCAPNIALYCSISLLIALIVVVMVVAYRHRWLLNYKLFLLKLAIMGYQEIRDDRDLDDFEFHFNIMFDEEDEGWVTNHLRPALEERLPEYNKNVYGDNNLPLGMHYCDAVHYVVEMSYKTIVLVSRAAIQDNWFVIKFRAAADQVNDTQTENMVVIFLEDIPDDELPFVVRLYLSNRKPYLRWDEEDEEFQEYFWQKLTKMLTINLRSNNVIPPE